MTFGRYLTSLSQFPFSYIVIECTHLLSCYKDGMEIHLKVLS